MDIFEPYLQQVINEEDKILVSEAITCARNHALRAAYITVWLAVAECLKRKFRVLATQDGNAQKVVTEIEQKEAQHQAIDSFVLRKAKEYGLITDPECTRLEHLYQMRCVYGHPYEEAPKQEALLAALAEATDVVLSKVAKLRHRFINDQVDLLVGNATYLDDQLDAVTRYAREIHPKIDDGLHACFMETLWKKLEAIAPDASMAMFFRRGVWFSREYLLIAPDAVLATWDTVSILTRYPHTSSLVLSDGGLWNLLSHHAKDIVFGQLVAQGSSEGQFIRAAEGLYESGALSARQQERFTAATSSMDLAYLASTGIKAKYFAFRIINDLKSHTWPVQNPAILVLTNTGPAQIAELPTETQRLLGNNVLQTAQGGSNAAAVFLPEIASGSQEWPPDFLFGMLQECFVNDNNEVRLKTDELGSAIRALSATSPELAEGIIKRVAALIDHGDTEQRPLFAAQVDRVTEFVKQLAEQTQFSLDCLITALESLKTKVKR